MSESHPPSPAATTLAPPRVLAPTFAAGLLLVAAIWAFAPLETPALENTTGPRDTEKAPPGPPFPPVPTLAALDRSAFRAPLWLAPPTPPPPPPAPAPTAPPPPLNLQLLAIIKEDPNRQDGGKNGRIVYKAMVYDASTDKLLVVGAGDSLGDRTIESIDPTGLRIKDGAATRTLTLKTEGGPP